MMLFSSFFILFLLLGSRLNTRWRSQSDLLLLVSVSHEVFRLIKDTLINHSSYVGLGLDTFDLGCGLQTDIKNFLLMVLNIMVTFGIGFDVLGVHVLSIPLNELDIMSKLVPRSRDPHPYQRSLILDYTVFDCFQNLGSWIKGLSDELLLDIVLFGLTIVAISLTRDVIL